MMETRYICTLHAAQCHSQRLVQNCPPLQSSFLLCKIMNDNTRAMVQSLPECNLCQTSIKLKQNFLHINETPDILYLGGRDLCIYLRSISFEFRLTPVATIVYLIYIPICGMHNWTITALHNA